MIIKNVLKISVISILSLLIITSCVTKKKLVYLQNISVNDSISAGKSKNLEIKVIPGENLFISFYNSNMEINALLNGGKSVAASSAMALITYFNAYPVSDSGYIDIPVVGKIQVNGLSIEEVRTKIADRVNTTFSETFVSVRLAERSFTLLGEFKMPGTYTINKDKVSLFYVIGLAGDITEYGDRKNVKIIRQVNDKVIVTYVDLTNADFIKSPYYYLQHNDIVYIEPLKAKTFQTRTFPVTSILSIFTSVLAIYTIFNK